MRRRVKQAIAILRRRGWRVTRAEQIITATLRPAMSRLYDGQSVDDVTNYSTMVSLGNFATSANNGLASITSVDLTFQGDATAADDALAMDETAGFTATVGDDAGTTPRPFVASPITVEYKVQFEEVTGNIANTDINDIVGDAVDLGSIVIAGADAYNATYTGITAGDLRNGPYNWGASNSAGLPSISGIPGETLTGDYGLWSTPDGTTLTLTPRWLVDDVLEAGETGVTIDSSAYTGSDIKFAPEGDDGVNTPVTAASAAVSIPSGSGFAKLQVLSNDYTASSGTITDTVPAGAADASKEVFLVVAYARSGADGFAATLGGASPDASPVAHIPYAGANIRIMRWDVPAGGNLALSMTNTASWAGVSYWAFTVINRTTTTAKTANNASYAALDLSNAVTAGAEIIGAACLASNGTTGAFSYAGLSQLDQYQSHNGNYDQYLFAATADATETRTMTATPTGDGSGQVAAALVIME